MAAECFEHGKAFVGLCTWCGKQLCAKCVSKNDGRKTYCGKCAQQLYDYHAEKPKPVKTPSFDDDDDAPRRSDVFKLHDEPKVVAPTAAKGPMDSQIIRRALQSNEHIPSMAIKQSSFSWAQEKKPAAASGGLRPLQGGTSQSAQAALGIFAEKARKLQGK